MSFSVLYHTFFLLGLASLHPFSSFGPGLGLSQADEQLCFYYFEFLDIFASFLNFLGKAFSQASNRGKIMG